MGHSTKTQERYQTTNENCQEQKPEKKTVWYILVKIAMSRLEVAPQSSNTYL